MGLDDAEEGVSLRDLRLGGGVVVPPCMGILVKKGEEEKEKKQGYASRVSREI